MFCTDLSSNELFVKELVAASREHKNKLAMSTKKELDRQASFFFNHIKTINEKINTALLAGKDLLILTETNGVVNVVIRFTDEPFTNLDLLDKQIKKRLKVVEKIFNTKIAWSCLGATPNLDKRKDGTITNTVVTVSQFVTNCKVHNFAIVL